MKDHLIPLHCEFLQPGMYVAELDRSWLHTPFASSGFLITNERQIEQLRRYCNYVYIDEEHSDIDVEHVPPAHAEGIEVGTAPYGSMNAVKARIAIDATRNALSRAVREARRSGELDLPPLLSCVENLVRCAETSGEALLLLVRLEHHQQYVFRRAIGSAVHCIVLGRALGFEHDMLCQLGLGGLLMDVGKIAVPITILAKPDALSGEEQSFVRKHVARSIALVEAAGAPERVMEMIRGHHERIDGNGYPKNLRGTDIPLFARIAGIVDTFDALTLDRRYAAGMSAHSALRYLNSVRGIEFDGALVGEFTHALGVYPTGTVVEMNDGRIAVVVEQNHEWPLRPILATLTDEHRHGLAHAQMMAPDMGRQISRALSPTSVDVDALSLATDLRDEFAAH